MKQTHRTSPPKASLVTLGCPMNQVDSERITGGLAARGFEIVPEEEAEVIVVNTCGFIESAREESIETILSLADMKNGGRLKRLVVAGCMAQRYRDELERDLTEADAVVGLTDAGRIPDICCELIGYEPRGKPAYSRVLMGYPHTGYLKIAEGCDNRCTYCAIPAIRGPFRSVQEETVLEDARVLAGLGIHELILIGQDTTLYGKEFEGASLSRLLEKLHDIDGFGWIRLLYGHPAHIDDGLIDTIANLPKVVPYIDLPLQHIAAGVLKRMGRKTPPVSIRRLLDRIRERIDGVVLRTALITGFPGETDDDFNELLSFMEAYRFERLGAFVYSPEEGTPAASYDDEVPHDVAEARYDALMRTQQDISAAFNASIVGREFDMIVDEFDPATGEATGRTYMDAPDIDGNVFVPRGVQNGKPFYRIKVVEAHEYDIRGEIIGS